MDNQKESQKFGEELDEMISFSIDEEDYAVNIQTVKEVIRIKEISRLPKTPSFVKGVINLRGDVIPIIDLRDKFGLEQREYTKMTRVIVAELDGRPVGMAVDSASQVIRISSSDIEPPPPLVGGLSGEYLRGIGKLGEKLIILLNIDRILTAEEKIELERMEEVREPVEVN